MVTTALFTKTHTAPGSTTKSTINQPKTPTNLLATSPSKGKVSLRWVTPDGNWGAILGYRVERKTSGSYAVLVDHTGDADTSMTDSDVASGTTYTYRVSARTAEGIGTASNEATVIVT